MADSQDNLDYLKKLKSLVAQSSGSAPSDDSDSFEPSAKIYPPELKAANESLLAKAQQPANYIPSDPSDMDPQSAVGVGGLTQLAKQAYASQPVQNVITGKGLEIASKDPSFMLGQVMGTVGGPKFSPSANAAKKLQEAMESSKAVDNAIAASKQEHLAAQQAGMTDPDQLMKLYQGPSLFEMGKATQKLNRAQYAVQRAKEARVQRYYDTLKKIAKGK